MSVSAEGHGADHVGHAGPIADHPASPAAPTQHPVEQPRKKKSIVERPTCRFWKTCIGRASAGPTNDQASCSFRIVSSTSSELVVISPLKDWACSSCGGTVELLIMDDSGPLCMQCAELDTPRVPPLRRRRADQASEAKQPPVNCGCAVQPCPWTLRAPRSAGRGGSNRTGRSRLPRRSAGASPPPRTPMPPDARTRISSFKTRWRPRSPSSIPDAQPNAPCDRPARRDPRQRTRRAIRRRPRPPPAGARAGGHRLGPPPGHALRQPTDERSRPQRSPRTRTRRSQRHPRRVATS